MTNHHRRGSNSSGVTDEWIQMALKEYEQIASLCNAQSHLGNAVTSASTSFSAPFDASSDARDLDPKILTMELQRRSLHDSLSSYYQKIDAVRKTHALLKANLSSLSKILVNEDTDIVAKDDDGGEWQKGTRRQHPRLPVIEAFSLHIELSERVIRTVMQSLSSQHQNNNGLCGVLYENGIVRASSAGDHEANIVALASLRASVSQLKANFGGGGGG
jgi:monomeric isocitrate dehydrogenase